MIKFQKALFWHIWSTVTFYSKNHWSSLDHSPYLFILPNQSIIKNTEEKKGKTGTKIGARMAMSRRSSVCFLPGLSLGIPRSTALLSSRSFLWPSWIQMNHMHLLQTLFRHHAIDLKVCDLMVITTVCRNLSTCHRELLDDISWLTYLYYFLSGIDDTVSMDGILSSSGFGREADTELCWWDVWKPRVSRHLITSVPDF